MVHADIICLQEVENEELTLPGYNIVFNVDHSRRGTAIALKDFIKFTHVEKSLDSRMITLRVLNTTIANVYAPSGNNQEDFPAILSTLDSVLLNRRKDITYQRYLAFLKRIAMLTLQLLHFGSLGCLGVIKSAMALNGTLDVILDTETITGSGNYNPELDEPDYSCANCSNLYELSALHRHYHPCVRRLSTNIANGTPSTGPGSLPVDLAKISIPVLQNSAILHEIGSRAFPYFSATKLHGEVRTHSSKKVEECPRSLGSSIQNLLTFVAASTPAEANLAARQRAHVPQQQQRNNTINERLAIENSLTDPESCLSVALLMMSEALAELLSPLEEKKCKEGARLPSPFCLLRLVPLPRREKGGMSKRNPAPLQLLHSPARVMRVQLKVINNAAAGKQVLVERDTTYEPKNDDLTELDAFDVLDA
ncbi:pol-like protein [Culex quinquefasciatus]|uniref:Pol-like protein n=1 Tax=Culex quinquefasciatus TaxID=7176 RepID=B0X4R8_CULQU|nr:pol-like protein [Culex quinquefasciatus]|eukprot:XP_001864640.1 pol-like protein [Culex quinquefasciatus]